jgi:tetratricopeptide (TPR) repeat protein
MLGCTVTQAEREEMPAQREFRLFISAVSGELKSCRADVARVLRKKELEVRDQEHFRTGPATLLEQLARYIKNCDAVILLIGERAGAYPSDEHAAALGTIPIYDQYRRDTGQSRASYTQWEFLLALHFGKPAYVFIAGDGFVPDAPNNEPADCRSSQAAYRKWIEHRGKHYDVFASVEKLIEHVLVLPLDQDSASEAEDAGERRHREQMDAMDAMRLEIARDKGVDPANLIPLFEHLGQVGLTRDEMRVRAAEAVAEIVARSRRPVEASNDGADIDATIGAARQKLADLDTAGARTVLADKIAEEEDARRQRLVPLLAEKAAVERLGYDYASAKATLKQLLALSPDSVWRWIELGDICETTGSLAEADAAFRSAMDAARRTGDERHLSASYERVGDVLVAQGNLPEALKTFRDGLAIRDRLAKSDPGNAGWQRDLYSALWYVADVENRQGDLTAALPKLTAGRDIMERLAKSDPGNAEWQRDLSVSYIKVGDVLVVQGNLPEALKTFRDGLAIRDRLATSDPGNAGWQRDLYSALWYVADVEIRQGDLAAALPKLTAGRDIMERLAKSDPGNAGWQRDLSVSYERVGDVLVAQGNLPEALKTFRDGLAIADRLATSDPGNAGWQRDLSVSYAQLASVYLKSSDTAQARQALAAGRAVLAPLVERHPEWADWQRDLGWFDRQIDSLDR